jgi:PAS domain S-box-containing protein
MQNVHNRAQLERDRALTHLTENVKSGPLSRLLARLGKAAAPVFSSRDTLADTSIIDIGRSLEQRNAAFPMFPPMLLLANAAIAAGFAGLALERFSPHLVMVWTFGALFASVLPLPIGRWHARKGNSDPTTAIRLHEFCTVVLGLVWASFPALFFDAAASEVRILAVAIIYAISGIGSLALARVQSSAVLFCALIAGSLALASVKLGGEVGLALGAYSLLYSIAVAVMILHAHETARRRAAAETEVKKQNEIIALLLNDFDKGASNWLWETDRSGRLTYVSKRLCEGLGKTSAQLLGQSLAEAVLASPQDQGWKQLLEAIDARAAIDGCRLPIGFDTRQTWWRITARPLPTSDGCFAGYRGSAHDITDDHENEAGLIEAKETAEKANATKSQFLAVMSHELRTPLNAIVGFAELLASRQSENLSEETRADHLATIVESSRHLQALINDILDATRIERGTLCLVEQESDAAELVEVAVKMCRDVAEKADTTIIARIVEGVEFQGDITRIKQVLINLITNAVKFSAPGGFVNVGFERGAGGGLTIAVRDGGAGIRKEDLDRIFEPFVQADGGSSRAFGGIGLGLAIARNIAMLHGGNVTIESEFGVGTTARLILPASRITWADRQLAAAASAA